jgi:hypothetical protein
MAEGTRAQQAAQQVESVAILKDTVANHATMLPC